MSDIKQLQKHLRQQEEFTTAELAVLLIAGTVCLLGSLLVLMGVF